MKLAIVYIYPLAGLGHHLGQAIRFIDSYHQHPPGMDHETVIVCNGGPANDETRILFGSLPNVTLLEHDDSGKDIGGYQMAARSFPCDLMVFLGGSTYIKQNDWLARVSDSFIRNGDTLYGVMGNRGSGSIHPHIRTTGFWMSPSLFNQYPVQISRDEQRYPFEHGQNCLTSWIYRQNKNVWVVAWDGEYLQPDWDAIPNGFHSGDQSNLLVGDRLTEPPYYHAA